MWDPLVRVLHWTLAALLLLNYFFLEEGEAAHRYTGYAAFLAVLLRIVWGFVATGEHVRLASWFPTRARVVRYFRDPERRKNYLGHNPLAALMIYWLMFLVATLGASGWMLGLDAFFGEEWLEDLHELSGDLLVWSALVHAFFAVYTSMAEKRNRVAAMIHGRLPE